MATLITYKSGRLGYVDLVNRVRFDGVKRSPRGLDTYDLGPTTIVLESPFDALPLGVGRRLNAAIGAAEAVQLTSAHADHTLLPRISPTFVQFLEPESHLFHGAYGDRITDQISHVVRKLSIDPDTRQAVVTLWNPALDNVYHARDFPCTVALNFAIVNDKLELRTLMRSNDVWLGYPYDIFQFTQLQLSVARALACAPGTYTHTAWSLHMYATDADKLRTLAHYKTESPYQPTGFGVTGDSWYHVRHAAELILKNKAVKLIHGRPLTESEQWYVDQLTPHAAPRAT